MSHNIDSVKANDTSVEWRRLALQFDEHRMQALWHLQCILKDPIAHRAAVEAFLTAPPLDGDVVLAARLREIATTGLSNIDPTAPANPVLQVGV